MLDLGTGGTGLEGRSSGGSSFGSAGTDLFVKSEVLDATDTGLDGRPGAELNGEGGTGLEERFMALLFGLEGTSGSSTLGGLGTGLLARFTLSAPVGVGSGLFGISDRLFFGAGGIGRCGNSGLLALRRGFGTGLSGTGLVRFDDGSGLPGGPSPPGLFSGPGLCGSGLSGTGLERLGEGIGLLGGPSEPSLLSGTGLCGSGLSGGGLPRDGDGSGRLGTESSEEFGTGRLGRALSGLNPGALPGSCLLGGPGLEDPCTFPTVTTGIFHGALESGTLLFWMGAGRALDGGAGLGALPIGGAGGTGEARIPDEDGVGVLLRGGSTDTARLLLVGGGVEAP